MLTYTNKRLIRASLSADIPGFPRKLLINMRIRLIEEIHANVCKLASRKSPITTYAGLGDFVPPDENDESKWGYGQLFESVELIDSPLVRITSASIPEERGEKRDLVIRQTLDNLQVLFFALEHIAAEIEDLAEFAIADQEQHLTVEGAHGPHILVSESWVNKIILESELQQKVLMVATTINKLCQTVLDCPAMLRITRQGIHFEGDFHNSVGLDPEDYLDCLRLVPHNVDSPEQKLAFIWLALALDAISF